ncbi:hypothetical protein PIN31115_02086 [Pandoraea iniqua]|uniref:Uncharacterized protein n=1 Tax=Pandoraea iniqua TaxID=2508288 RepID=A0A5E4UMA1_9BURK|nr:hypothetical protein [Pandoraea iniqua]VVE00653.1 hypothetical protein PIN31115_02086 [Pandoraea iniqua]
MIEQLRMQEKGSRPHIRFEPRPVEDRAASIDAGRKVYKDEDWVIITPSGGKDVREDIAEAWLRKIEGQAQTGMYDFEWAKDFRKMYEMYKDGQELPEDGTPLKMCTTLFTPAEIQNCLAVNVRTLESLADSNEEALMRIGMGARALKLRAAEALKTGDGKESAMKVEALTIENASLREQVGDLRSVVEELRTQMATMMAAPKAARAGKNQSPDPAE